MLIVRQKQQNFTSFVSTVINSYYLLIKQAFLYTKDKNIKKGDMIMSFELENITHQDSLKIGSDDATLKVIEYINLRCPDSKNYEENIAPYLDPYIEDGKVQRILKHYDKKKYPLEAGSVMNQYLNYSTPKETYNLTKRLFKEQNDWGMNRLSQIPHIAKEYGLTLQDDNHEQANRIDIEVRKVKITKIPTIFVGDIAFEETVDKKQFKKVVEDGLK